MIEKLLENSLIIEEIAKAINISIKEVTKLKDSNK